MVIQLTVNNNKLIFDESIKYVLETKRVPHQKI